MWRTRLLVAFCDCLFSGRARRLTNPLRPEPEKIQGMNIQGCAPANELPRLSTMWGKTAIPATANDDARVSALRERLIEHCTAVALGLFATACAFGVAAVPAGLSAWAGARFWPDEARLVALSVWLGLGAPLSLTYAKALHGAWKVRPF